MMKWFIIALRIGFGVILIAASIDKLLHPIQFAQAVENYQVFGEVLSRWVAIWLPYLEISTGALLILGIWFDAAAILNFLMMTLFFFALIQAYVRGLDINCGCFSVEGGAKLGLGKLLYNLLLLGGSFILLFFTVKGKHRLEKN
jgi:uncharacterized membrane protein YphA (DoxX/SURF4 family)